MISKPTKLIIVTAALLAGAAGINACAAGSSTAIPGGAGGSPGSGGSTGTKGTGGTTGATGTGGSTGTTGTGGRTGTTGTGGTTGATGTGGSTGTTGTGGTTGATGTGGSTGATGTGGAMVVQKVCATKITPMNPALVDFENYNGMVTADKYGTAFGGATANTGTAYIGPISWGDGTTTPTLSILAGHPPGNWGLSQTVTQAAAWGMGGAFWMGCANATAYKGITFWVRGSVPDAKFSFSMDMESTLPPDATNAAGGGTCAGTKDTCKPALKADIPITVDWTQVKILWADFTPGISGTTTVVPNGDNIAGFGWSVNIPFVPDPAAGDASMPPYIPKPSDLVFNLDDLAFIP
jgi:hypothetical protein